MAGKGDKPRKVNKKKFDVNFDRIFSRCPKCNSRKIHELHTDNGMKMCLDCRYTWGI